MSIYLEFEKSQGKDIRRKNMKKDIMNIRDLARRLQQNGD